MSEKHLCENRQLPNETLALEYPIQSQTVIKTDGEVILYQKVFNSPESDRFFWELQDRIKWQQRTITLFGKTNPLPRLTAWYGDEGKSYTYSRIENSPEPWIPILNTIKSRIETIAEVRFNSVLINLYRTGKDYMGWHSDDEKQMGENSVIGSVSFGGTRRFSLRHKTSKSCQIHLELEKGSFLLMKGATQQYWQHQVAKTSKLVQPRINLTFRAII